MKAQDDHFYYANSGSALQEKRERVFLILAGVFLCAMTMLNVIGITRFVQLGPLQVAVGVLAYPITFLCTDVISELYGKRRANFMVTVGLLLNGFILAIMYLANTLPPVDPIAQPPWQTIKLANSVSLANGQSIDGAVELFSIIYTCTSGAVLASMLAYIAAQYVDVFVFHKIRKVTNGKYMWVRNNVSTLTSQLVDSIMVVTVTFGAAYLAGQMTLNVLLGLLISNYLFKAIVALLDTPIIYIVVGYLRKKLDIPLYSTR